MSNETPVLFITRRAHFNAAHKLFNPLWTKEENDEVFGKCANEHWHGHNFDLFVTIKGHANPNTGFVMDLKRLKTIIEKEVVEKLDHKNLNLDVPFLQGVLPSIENIVIAIWNILILHLPENVKLHKLHLIETQNNSVEYYGPNIPF
ncbi:MAG: 6-carboxytetrahydropterin synthase [Bacteroidota bacterium]|nr:6-carboxytetrahydropterin synthase [Bacteroidota bacterium]